MLAKEKKSFPHPSKEKKGKYKKRADALLKRVWSNRKRREIMDILSHFDPSNEQRCYFGGFLRYGVGLSVDEIMEICDAYALWNDYDRDKTAYYLRHIAHSSKKSHREEERSDDSRLYLPQELPEEAKRVIEIPDSAGFVMSWIRVEGELG